MPNKCFVPFCKSGYDTDVKRIQAAGGKPPSMFNPPEDLLEEWAKQICRVDRPLTVKDFVCALHFKKEEIVTHYVFTLPGGVKEKFERGTPVLKKGAIPSIFPRSSRLRKRHGTRSPPLIKLPNKKIKSASKNQINNGHNNPNATDTEANVNSADSSPSRVEKNCSDSALFSPSKRFNVNALHEMASSISLPGSMWGVHQIPGRRRTAFVHLNDNMEIDKTVEFTTTCNPNVKVFNKPLELPEVQSREQLECLLRGIDAVKSVDALDSNITKKPQKKLQKLEPSGKLEKSSNIVDESDDKILAEKEEPSRRVTRNSKNRLAENGNTTRIISSDKGKLPKKSIKLDEMLFGTKCAVACCGNNRLETRNEFTNIFYHRFPTDEKIMKKWMEKLKLKDSRAVKSARVCSEHFRKEDYKGCDTPGSLGSKRILKSKGSIVKTVFSKPGPRAILLDLSDQQSLAFTHNSNYYVSLHSHWDDCLSFITSSSATNGQNNYHTVPSLQLLQKTVISPDVKEKPLQDETKKAEISKTVKGQESIRKRCPPNDDTSSDEKHFRYLLNSKSNSPIEIETIIDDKEDSMRANSPNIETIEISDFSDASADESDLYEELIQVRIVPLTEDYNIDHQKLFEKNKSSDKISDEDSDYEYESYEISFQPESIKQDMAEVLALEEQASKDEPRVPTQITYDNLSELTNENEKPCVSKLRNDGRSGYKLNISSLINIRKDKFIQIGQKPALTDNKNSSEAKNNKGPPHILKDKNSVRVANHIPSTSARETIDIKSNKTNVTSSPVEFNTGKSSKSIIIEETKKAKETSNVKSSGMPNEEEIIKIVERIFSSRSENENNINDGITNQISTTIVEENETMKKLQVITEKKIGESGNKTKMATNVLLLKNDAKSDEKTIVKLVEQIMCDNQKTEAKVGPDGRSPEKQIPLRIYLLKNEPGKDEKKLIKIVDQKNISLNKPKNIVGTIMNQPKLNLLHDKSSLPSIPDNVKLTPKSLTSKSPFDSKSTSKAALFKFHNSDVISTKDSAQPGPLSHTQKLLNSLPLSPLIDNYPSKSNSFGDSLSKRRDDSLEIRENKQPLENEESCDSKQSLENTETSDKFNLADSESELQNSLPVSKEIKIVSLKEGGNETKQVNNCSNLKNPKTMSPSRNIVNSFEKEDIQRIDVPVKVVSILGNKEDINEDKNFDSVQMPIIKKHIIHNKHITPKSSDLKPPFRKIPVQERYSEHNQINSTGDKINIAIAKNSYTQKIIRLQPKSKQSLNLNVGQRIRGHNLIGNSQINNIKVNVDKEVTGIFKRKLQQPNSPAPLKDIFLAGLENTLAESLKQNVPEKVIKILPRVTQKPFSKDISQKQLPKQKQPVHFIRVGQQISNKTNSWNNSPFKVPKVRPDILKKACAIIDKPLSPKEMGALVVPTNSNNTEEDCPSASVSSPKKIDLQFFPSDDIIIEGTIDEINAQSEQIPRPPSSVGSEKNVRENINMCEHSYFLEAPHPDSEAKHKEEPISGCLVNQNLGNNHNFMIVKDDNFTQSNVSEINEGQANSKLNLQGNFILLDENLTVNNELSDINRANSFDQIKVENCLLETLFADGSSHNNIYESGEGKNQPDIPELLTEVPNSQKGSNKNYPEANTYTTPKVIVLNNLQIADSNGVQWDLPSEVEANKQQGQGDYYFITEDEVGHTTQNVTEHVDQNHQFLPADSYEVEIVDNIEDTQQLQYSM